MYLDEMSFSQAEKSFNAIIENEFSEHVEYYGLDITARLENKHKELIPKGVYSVYVIKGGSEGFRVEVDITDYKRKSQGIYSVKLFGFEDALMISNRLTKAIYCE